MIDIPDPAPHGRQVLVRVLASTINIDDIHVAEGTFYGGIPIGARPNPDRPVTPGSDLAGVVTAIGKDVRSIHIGDAVFGVQMAYRARGAWAEVCAIDERWLTIKPESLSFATAAACGVSGLVALSAIHALKLRPGSRVVIVGATGGIGGMAVQLAVRAGAEVIGVCGSANAERAYQLGCSLVLDYHAEPWDRKLRARPDSAATGRIDRVLDTVGGRDIEEAGRRVLGTDGVFVTVVGPRRFIGDRALGWAGVLTVLARVGYRIIASRIRGPRYVLTGPSPSGGSALPEVARAAAAGILPLIDSTVPFELEPMRQALRRAAAHENHGRIVIQMDNAARCAASAV
jgi:NADPH:quinone reductase-like Zn-dependent oxidoreductase